MVNKSTIPADSIKEVKRREKDMLESSIESSLVEGTKKIGGWCVKFFPMHVAGFPDRMCLFQGGVIVFVELKAPGKKPKKLQDLIHKRLRALGFRVEVIDSLQDIVFLLKDYAK